jgi:DNA primase
MTNATITLSTIVGRKVALQRRTDHQLLGCCPFHAEHTPSFVIDDQVGEFHCLGCGVRGDAMDFVVKTEPLLMRAILEWLDQLGGGQ